MSNTKAQTRSYPDRFESVQKNLRTLAAAQPAVMEAFNKLHKAGVTTRALDRKTKELIALAISVVERCDDCIAHHIHDTLEAGASREEITEALGVAILMGGGPSMIYATHAIEAVDQYLANGS